MAASDAISNNLAADPQAAGNLRKLANSANTQEGIKAAAKQFEAYFLQMMLRSMRDTVSSDGPFDSQETKMFTEMFDQQISQAVAQGKGIGLAEILAAQVQQQLALASKGSSATEAKSIPFDLPQNASDTAVEQTADVAARLQDSTAPGASFVDKLWPHATEAAQSLGVAPHFLIGQAALESGWGKHELKTPDGGNSYNLFNLKAGSNWKGQTVEKQVTEYVNGKAVQSTEKFRVYGSYAEGFADYAKLLSSNPRYANVLNQDAEGFARGLQKAGFATDPAYAEKLQRILGSSAFRSAITDQVG